MVTGQVVPDPKRATQVGVHLADHRLCPYYCSWPSDRAAAWVRLQIQPLQDRQQTRIMSVFFIKKDRKAKPASGLCDKLKSINMAVLI